MNKLLFLDDLRMPEHCAYYCHNNVYLHGKWAIVRDYKNFVEYIEYYFGQHKCLPDLISFDHDLADSHYAPKEFWDDKYNNWLLQQGTIEKTGYHCAKWLTDFCMDNNIKFIHYLCHSMNPAGKKNIESILNQFNRLNKDE